MKKNELNKKLRINKVTISQLSKMTMNKVLGGNDVPTDTVLGSCKETCVNQTCVGSGHEGCVSNAEPITCRWCDPTDAYVC